MPAAPTPPVTASANAATRAGPELALATTQPDRPGESSAALRPPSAPAPGGAPAANSSATSSMNNAAASSAAGSPGSPGSPLLPPGPKGELSNPTGAPRSDRESSPVSLTPQRPAVIVPGGVLAGEGIEIKTVSPRFSPVAQVSSLPGNTHAKIVFSKDGQVIDVTLVKSSGYPNIDGPIVSSLYQWKATGRMLAELNRSFSIEVVIVLSRGE